MRLIDADSLKDFIDCGHLRPPTELCFSELDVCNIIDKRTTIEMPSWIPVSERLPEEREVVLITNDKGNVRYGQFRGTRGKYWYWKGNTLEEVIAWMELPEPYREDGES